MAFSQRRPIVITVLVAGAFYMENLDGTVIATALPKMAESFGTYAVNLSVGMSAYMLALAIFIPISGWVADRFGARTVFATAIGIFTFSSILCAFSNNLWQFTAARTLQGMGGAMMVPVGRLVVLRNTEKKDLLRAIAYITWPGLVAPVIGPPLGGFIITYVSWRWIFYLNVPLGVVGIVLSAIFIPNDVQETTPELDFAGFLLSGAACMATMYGLDLMGHQDAPWRLACLLLAGGAVACVFAVRHARRHPHPLLELSALKIPTFAITIWGGTLFRIAIYSSPFVLPLMFQVGFGLSAFTSGMYLLALFAGNLGMKPLTTPTLRRFGFRKVLVANGLLTAVTILACVLLTPGTPKFVIMAVLFCGGMCRSMQFTSLNTLGFADVPEAKMSGANTFFSAMQQMSMGMGIAFGAISLQIAQFLRPGAGAGLSVPQFHLALFLTSLVAAAAVIDCYQLDRNAGAAVSGRYWPEPSPAGGAANS